MCFNHVMVPIMAVTSVSTATNQNEMEFQRVLKCIVMMKSVIVVSTTHMDSECMN